MPLSNKQISKDFKSTPATCIMLDHATKKGLAIFALANKIIFHRKTGLWDLNVWCIEYIEYEWQAQQETTNHSPVQWISIVLHSRHPVDRRNWPKKSTKCESSSIPSYINMFHHQTSQFPSFKLLYHPPKAAQWRHSVARGGRFWGRWVAELIHRHDVGPSIVEHAVDLTWRLNWPKRNPTNRLGKWKKTSQKSLGNRKINGK